MDYRQLDGTSTTAATDSPMTDQQAPERIDARIPDHCWWAVPCDEIEALRQRVAESENKLNEQSFKLIAMTERAEKAESERDQARKDAEHWYSVTLAANETIGEIRAASAAREIAMRDRAAQEADDWFYDPEHDSTTDTLMGDSIRALPLSPDGQQALDDVRAKEWDAGHEAGWSDRNRDDWGDNTPNPHRKE